MESMDTLENNLIEQTFQFLELCDPASVQRLKEDVQRVIGIAAMARNYPSLLSQRATNGPPSDSNPLLSVLCSSDPGLSSLSVPIRAVLGETFLTAKIQLFQSFRAVLAEHREQLPAGLLEKTEREVAQSIHTMLLTELLWDLVRYRTIPIDTRQRAAVELVRIWESPDELEIEDFFPLLASVWSARNRIQVSYGTLIGVSEFFQLMREKCPPFFVDYFTRADVSNDEKTAFQEFLFGLPAEDLASLREAMQESGLHAIDRKFAADRLSFLNASAHSESSPEALYVSYRRRQRATELRRSTGAAGPPFTAEAYLVLHVLNHPEYR